MQAPPKLTELVYTGIRLCDRLFMGVRGGELDQEGFVRKHLKKFPRWSSGHLQLARIAYQQDDARLCYASCQAVLLLDGNSDEVHEAKMYIGKCHLLKLEYQRALAVFQELWQQRRSTALREEIAACYFGMGQSDLANSWLSEIPTNEISAEARAALNYCQQNGGSSNDPPESTE